MRIWPEVHDNVYWLVRDGQIVNLWNDIWVPHIGMLKVAYRRIPIRQYLQVCDLVDRNGSWDWGYLKTLLPDNIIL